MKSYQICCLPGDGIGPEILAQGVRVLEAVAARCGFAVRCENHAIGGVAIDATGTPLPDETLAAAEAADAVLLASVGGPRWDTTDPAAPRPEQGLLGIRKALGLYLNLRPVHVFDALVDASSLKPELVRGTDPAAPRPEQGLLGIRKALGLYLNLRPVHVFDALVDASSLKPELVRGVDMLIVRELTGGLYFGARERIEDAPGKGVDGAPGVWCSDALEYGEGEIDRVVRFAFEAAAGRPGGHVCSVDKANVLGTSKLWRDVAERVAAENPDIPFENMLVDNCAMQLVARPAQFDVLVTENTFGDILSDEASMLTGSLGIPFENMLVDNCAMQLVARPAQFDVLVTENTFGDILSDEASMLTGSLGMLASASLGSGTPLFEPSHGSAPDIAGLGIANPLAQILSVALLCRHGLGEAKAADMIEAAVEQTLNDGWRTRDIAAPGTPEGCILGTDAMCDKVLERL